MRRTKQPADKQLEPEYDLLNFLDTLPDALFFIDKQQRIVYANESAAVLAGSAQKELVGNSFWQCTPRLVSLELYRAMASAQHTRKARQIEYCSPVTSAQLHMHLLPTSAGIVLSVHEEPNALTSWEAMCEDRQIFRDILEKLSTSVILLTPEGIVLSINQEPLQSAQVQLADVIGKPFAETPWWSHIPASQQALCEAITQAGQGKSVQFEARIRSGERGYLDRAAAITPHLDADGNVEYLIYTSSDITARKHAEEELLALVDAMPQLVWIGRSDGYLEYHNQRWRDYTCLSLEQAQGDGWGQSVHPDDRPEALATWHTAVRTGNAYELEQRVRNGVTGEYRWFLSKGAPYKDAQGNVIKWIGTLTDIDDQKRGEQRLKANEEQLRVLAETVPQFVWATGPNGYLEYWNQRFIDYLQTVPEILQGYGWRQFVHPDDIARVIEARTYSLETGTPYEMAYRLREGKTGAYRWFLARGMPVRDETGQIIRWFGTCTDIEEQKRIEEALRQSQERAQALMESTIIGILVADGERVVEANQAFLQMSGYSREEVQSGELNLPMLMPPESADRDQQAAEEFVTSRQIKPYETACRRKDGSDLPVLVGAIALPGNPNHSISFVLDNSARKELERRKDDFISMAGHELRTPLTSLKLQTQLLKRQLARQGSSAPIPVLARMEEQVTHLERLVSELLDVSKIQAGKMEYLRERVELDKLIQEIADVMQQINTTHTIIVRNSGCISLVGDRDRLGQVFTNLLSNAIKYSPSDSLVEVQIFTRASMACVSVRDQGIGITQEQREKIFERFYRAVTPDQKALPGLGMGLYIVAEIIKQHGGTISVESSPGQGSTFCVELPLVREDLL